MFKGLFAHSLRMELEEIRHKHKLEIQELRAQLDRERHNWEEDKQRLINDLQRDHDLKIKEAVTLTKLQSEQKIKQAELDYDRKLNEATKSLNEDYYQSLKSAMTKLHEEGNITTKFTQELALKMFDKSPATKVLTGSIDVNNGGNSEP